MGRKSLYFGIIVFSFFLIFISGNLFSFHDIEVEGEITKIYKEKRTRNKIFWMATLKTTNKIYKLKLLPVGICSVPAFEIRDKIKVNGYIPKKFKSSKIPLIVVNKLYIYSTKEEFFLRNKIGKIKWYPAQHKIFYLKAVKIERKKGDFNDKVQWIHLIAQVKGKKKMTLDIRMCPSFTCFDLPVKEGDLIRVDGYFPPYPEGQRKPAFIACTVNNLTRHRIIKIRDCKTRRPFWLNNK